jgi:mannose-6-phosphate isomerase
LPAGALHALGPGLLVAEIQQASDTTYRLYDWSRLGADGKPRPLHVSQALEAIDYRLGPLAAQQPRSTGREGVERLVACDQFVLDRWTLSGTRHAGGDDRCHILAVIAGALEIDGDPAGRTLERGDVALLPAELPAVRLTASASAVLLDAYLP